jgi:hypothetical protein
MSKPPTYYPIQTAKHAPSPAIQPAPSSKRSQQGEEVEALRRSNSELKEREKMYMDKLFKLQSGLEKQHTEFVKLQQLYTDLFLSY